MRKKERSSQLIACALALLLMGPIGSLGSTAFAQTTTSNAPSGQVPQPDQGGVNWSGVGYGVGALATNILYIPAKLVYAILGGIVGGGAWAVTAGNTQTANTIWRSSLGGDYVVTPDMLAGKEPIHFSGPTETAPIAPDNSATVQPLTPPPSNSAPLSSSPPAASNAPPAAGGGQPMDRGAGSVHPPPTLPDTSIE